MNFKRGIAATEAMGVGQVAIAPEIKRFYTLDPTRMIPSPNGGKAFPQKTLMPHPDTLLEAIEAGNPSAVNLRFLAFTTGTEVDQEGNDLLHRVSEYKGLYLKYGDRTYKIPK
jgi:hypothetical protein